MSPAPRVNFSPQQGRGLDIPADAPVNRRTGWGNHMTAAGRVLAPFWYGVLALPTGMTRGFVSVTLAFYLRQHGVPFAAIAGMASLVALPFTWKFVVGPLVDALSTPTRWYVLSVAAAACCVVALGFGAGVSAPMPLMGALALVAGAAAATCSDAVCVAMVQNSPGDRRGVVAGWINAGQLGGSGVGGGAALWVASSGGGVALAGLALGLAIAPCVAPLLWLRLARVVHGDDLKIRAKGVWRAVSGLLRTRAGLLVLLFCLAPTGLNEAVNLMPALAVEWKAPAATVALVSGVLGGLTIIPGCVVGGYLCRRFSPKAVYIATGVACAIVELVIAFSPRTPGGFTAMVLLNAAILGTNWAAITAVAFEILGEAGAATVSSLLSSASNVPLVIMAMVVGALHQRFGTTTMFLGEVAIAVVCLVGLTALTLLWRTPRAAWPSAETAVAAAG